MIEIKSEAEFATLINTEDIVLVDFYAPWCGPCRKLAPLLEEVESELNTKVKFAKINTDENMEMAKQYQVSGLPTLMVFKNGEAVEPGTQLTEGSINPTDLLRIKGLKGLQDYLLSEVIMIYKGQDVTINDKHIEVIIRQMLKKVKIENSGDTNLLPGDVVDVFDYEAENDRVLAEGGIPATAKRALLGITKAALSTESFLSSASFQAKMPASCLSFQMA